MDAFSFPGVVASCPIRSSSSEMTTQLPWFAANLFKSVLINAQNSIFVYCICEHEGFVTYSSEDNSIRGQRETKKNQKKKPTAVIDDMWSKHKASPNKDLERCDDLFA